MGEALNVAIFGGSLTEWQRRALIRVEETTDIQYTLVVTQSAQSSHSLSQSRSKCVTLQNWFRNHRWWTIIKIERYIRSALYGPSEYDELFKSHSVDEVDILRNVERLEVDLNSDGIWNEIPATHVKEIAAKCDVAIRFGFGLLRGDILSAIEYGVLSFHPADIRHYRGQGTVQAFITGDSTAGATLQRLTEEIDAGEIIAVDTFEIDNCWSLERIQVQVRYLMIELLSEGISNLQDPTFEPLKPNSLGEYYSVSDRNSLSFSLQALYLNQLRRLRARWKNET